MKMFSNVVVIALMLAGLANSGLLRKNMIQKQGDDPFENALKFTREVNRITENFGTSFWKSVSTGGEISLDDYQKELAEILPVIPETNNPFVYELDSNHDGLVSESEAKVGMRNDIINLARLVAFNGLKPEYPDSPYKRNLGLIVAFVADRYKRTKRLVHDLFVGVDQDGNGKITTEEFLKAFRFARDENTDAILAEQNADGGEKITEDQAFNIFGLLVLNEDKKTK